MLDRFARYADQPAFEALLRRHGPLVRGVCRRDLINPADVDDAFQPTFLVLARKAAAVRSSESVGSWLYGVAHRVSMRMRTAAGALERIEPQSPYSVAFRKRSAVARATGTTLHGDHATLREGPMPDGRVRGLAQFLRGLADEGRGGHAADRELLGRFIGGRDEAAFRALVCRHGPMVFRVCLRVLRREYDAEDAFQATFLVLARKAAAVQKSDSLESWLYGVAYRVSQKMRTAAARRLTREGEIGRPEPVDPLAELTVREAQEVLEQELANLPDKYRAPLVLCCLEGLTRDEAARRLGWELGALKNHLERARELLRARLSRRGLTIPAALLAGLLGSASVTGAAVPTELVGATVRAVAMVAAGRSPTTLSAEAVASAEGVLRAMTPSKVKATTVLLVTVAFVGAMVGAGVLASPTADPPSNGILPSARAAVARAAPVPKEAARTDLDKLQGVWTMVSRDHYGVEKAPAGLVKKQAFKLTIKGDQWTWAIPGGSVSGTITIDPSKTPKALDITTKVDGKESLRRGVYKLEGDTLTYCLERGIAILEEDGTPRKLDRPAAFAVTEDSSDLIVWKRSTP